MSRLVSSAETDRRDGDRLFAVFDFGDERGVQLDSVEGERPQNVK